LLALEHVRAEDPGLARWQARVNPFWKAVNSGCNLNRPTSRNIEAAGLSSNRWMSTWRHDFQSRWSVRGSLRLRGRLRSTPLRMTRRPALSSRSRLDRPRPRRPSISTRSRPRASTAIEGQGEWRRRNILPDRRR
jgi:hypothetical protein